MEFQYNPTSNMGCHKALTWSHNCSYRLRTKIKYCCNEYYIIEAIVLFV